jgi:Kef-type K+ transport system membrane component KefB
MIEFISSIEFQMVLLLFVALAGYLVAIRINQSAVIGIILVGILVGPSFLNLITYTGFVESLAKLGAVILLFVVGLEFKLADIAKFKYVVIALSGVIVPWIGGYAFAKLFGFDFASAIMVGAALTATSIAITANVLREMGKLQTTVAKAIIATAVIDDVLALLALSVSTNMISGTFSVWSSIWIFGKAILFLVIGVALGFLVISRLVVKLDRSKITQKYPEVVFIFALMIAFFYALSAEFIGLSGIVGAFIAGVSLEGINLRHGKSYKEGADFLYIVFASIFFVSLGILVDFGALTWSTVFFLIGLTVIAILTKIIGCGIPYLLQKNSFKDSLILGIGMTPRGEVAMIVALLGLSQHLIGQEIYVALVLMSLLTTVFTPLVLRNWFYREESRRIEIPIKR